MHNILIIFSKKLDLVGVSAGVKANHNISTDLCQIKISQRMEPGERKYKD